jgi:cobalt/nickel transport system permease protein
MKDRRAFAAYLVAVIVVTLIHDVLGLGAGLLIVGLIAGRQTPALLRRTLLPVLFFNLAVSLGYAATGLLGGDFRWGYLALMNVRVILLTFLTFLMVSRVDLLRALGFSRTLTYLIVLALSQIMTFRRLHQEFRLAGESRRLRRPSLRDGYTQGAVIAVQFFDKAEHGAGEIALAMRSRGFFGPTPE